MSIGAPDPGLLVRELGVRLLAAAQALPAVPVPPMEPLSWLRWPAAYRAAHYRLASARGVPGLCLTGLDDPSGCLRERVQAWLDGHGAVRAVIITACQPFSLGVSAEQDRDRHAQWSLAVESSGWRHVPATGVSAEGLWPDEPGWALLDLPASLEAPLLQACSQWAAVVLDGHGARLSWHPAWPVEASSIGVKNSTS